MERRFTTKDLILACGMALLFVVLLLTMYMIDRQWQKLAQMQTSLTEQAEDMRALRQSLSKGLITTTTQGIDTAIPDAFRRAEQATQQSKYAEGDWLVHAFATALKTITPLVSSDLYAAQVQGYVLESLLIRNPETLAWNGLLAKDWRVNAAGDTYTFELRNNIVFSDGKPLTANDVVFTFNFIMNPRIAAPRERAYYEKIKSVRAINKYKVEFKFKEPYFNSLGLAGGMVILAKHFYEPYLKNPRDFNESRGLLFGSGPYRLKDAKGWTADQNIIELDRNTRYWGPVQPAYRKVLWKIIENDSARLTAFRNGEIDAYSARPLELKSLKEDKQLQRKARHYAYMSPVAGYRFIGWNEKRADKPTRFADRRVRLAMTYLTNRQRLIKEIMLGLAEPAVGPFHAQSPQHDENIIPYPYDPAKAKQLLQEAGYADRNDDGVLENAAGAPFTFELMYFQDSDDLKRTTLFLKDLYARAGILLKPKPSEWPVLIGAIDKRDYDAVMIGWSGGIEEDIYQIFHSSQMAAGADNFVNYKNTKLDKLIEQARATVDEKKRMPLWHQCERILHEDQPYTFLMRSKSLTFLDKRIENTAITKLGLNVHLLPLEWYTPRNIQRYR